MSDDFEFDAFISHSSMDKEVIRNLVTELRSHGLRVWFDESEIAVAQHIGLRIEDGLKASRKLIVAMSRNAFESEWVKAEFWTRLFANPTNSTERIIPVRLDDSELPDFFKPLAYVDWRAQSNRELVRLVAACKGLAFGSTMTAETRLKEAHSRVDENDFEQSARLAEEAVELAKLLGETHIEMRAHLQVAHSLFNGASFRRLSRGEVNRLAESISTHVDDAKRLGASTRSILIARILVSRLQRDYERVAALADDIMIVQDATDIDKADAIIARLEAMQHLGQTEQISLLENDVTQLLAACSADARLVLGGAWLQAMIVAKRNTESHAASFLQSIRRDVESGELSRRRAVDVLGAVANSLNRAATHDEDDELNRAAITMLEAAYSVAEPGRDARLLTQIATGTAELAAVSADAPKTRYFLDLAGSWLQASPSPNVDGAEEDRVSLRALTLLAKGRTISRLVMRLKAGAERPDELLHDGYKALCEAQELTRNQRSLLHGDVDLYMADVSRWLGGICKQLGWYAEAARHFRSARSPAAMANRGFYEQAGIPAWICEAECLCLAGELAEAEKVTRVLCAQPQVPPGVVKKAQSICSFLQYGLRPIVDWLASTDARAIGELAKRQSLRHAIAQQFAPIVSWWKEWHEVDRGPQSELFDFWGRGGFCRVAAAVRAKPNSAIAVDATSVDSIRRWARIFCPLFDTVIVLWKGPLGAGIVLTPLHVAYGDEGAFGGHGYMVTSDMVRDEWCVSMAWANPIPRELAVFLATEALPLVSSGRLVVLPAPLVGCTQTAIGWTDDLLTRKLLGGVVTITNGRHPSLRSDAQGQRILDVSKNAIPFIENVALVDLAYVMDELDDFVQPLRRLLFNSLAEDLRGEHWERINAVESDFRDACHQLRVRMESLGPKADSAKWHIVELPGAVSASEPAQDNPGSEPVTDFLQALTAVERDVAPWIPYWRLEGLGGYLDWICHLDNPSTPDDGTGAAFTGESAIPKEVHSWLYPGTGGWGIATASRA